MFKGAFTALVTPFRDGSIDSDALRAHVDRQIAGGIDGLGGGCRCQHAGRCDAGDVFVADADVRGCPGVPGAVDEAPAEDQQVEGLGRLRWHVRRQTLAGGCGSGCPEHRAGGERGGRRE